MSDKLWVGSKFNYCFKCNDDCLIYNTLYTNLYKVESKIFDVLSSRNEGVDKAKLDEKILTKLKQDKLVIPVGEDEEIIARHYAQRIIYDNKLDVTIVPTQGCNFRCSYCFEEHNGNNRMNDESEEKIIRFFERNIRKYKTVKITWFGGEPLLEKDRIIRIMQAINCCGKRYGVPILAQMITNGYLLDTHTFEELLSNNVLYYEITVDGLAKHHDRLRPLIGGQGTYTRIINNITDIQKNVKGRYQIVIRTNVDRKSEADYDVFREQLGLLLDNDKHFVFVENKIMDWGGTAVKNIASDLLLDNEMYSASLNRQEYERYYSAATQDLSELRCNAGKYNGFVIMHDATIHKCTKISYSDSTMNEKEINYVGYITKGGQLIADETKCAHFLALPELYEKCHSCCWLPICQLSMCPIRGIKDKSIRCKMKNEVDKKNTEECILAQYYKGNYTDLTII